MLLFNLMLGSIFFSFVLYLLSYITIHRSNSGPYLLYLPIGSVKGLHVLYLLKKGYEAKRANPPYMDLLQWKLFEMYF